MALVVFLRGVNVGGHKNFRPAMLAKQLKHLDVVNIGAAGTFIIQKRAGIKRLRFEFARRLPFDAEIMICKGRDIAELVSRDVFSSHPPRRDVVRFVSILSKSSRATPSLPMPFPSSGKWLLKILAQENRFIFGLYRRHMKVIGFLGALDRVFGVPVTTRNWNTILAIAKTLNDK